MTTPEPDPIHEMAKQIMQQRHKILDDFCKAYLAENAKNIPIRDLVLNEQQIDGRYRWWWSLKDEEYMK